MVMINRIMEIGWPTKKWPTHDMGRDMKFNKLTVCPDFKENTKLYRFMSFDKFKSLMSTRKLFFAMASELSDKFEGGHLIPGLEEECIKNRDSTFISCWTKRNPQDKDSLFMWRPHYDGEKDIAIRVSIATFFLDRYFSYLFQDEIFEKYIGNIEYDPDKEDYPEEYKINSFVPFFIKRDCFRDEKEVRIAIQDMVPENSCYSFKPYKKLEGKDVDGIPISIDLKKIEEYIISPVAEPDTVKSIKDCISKAGLNKPNIKKLPEPLDGDLDRAIEKVKLLDEYNKKSLNNFENHNKINILLEEYLNSEVKGDASGNIYCNHTGNINSNHIKTKQQCQSDKRDNYILLNILLNKTLGDRVFLCHWFTNLYLMHKF